MSRVLVTEPLADEGMALLRAQAEVDVLPATSSSQLAGVIGPYHALVVRSKTQVTGEALAAARSLAVVGRAGTGVDNIDLDAATRRGVVVVNAPYGNTISVAELTLGLLLALVRHIPFADAAMRQGRWEKQSCEGVQVRGKVLGLIGLGRVGLAVARRALGLEMKVVAYDAFVTPERAALAGVQWLPLEDLLSTADVVSLHLPDTPQTRGFIGGTELARMKPSAYLINCARGSLVDELALTSALRSGRLAGAALDVFAAEPPPDSPLLHLDSVVLSPHLAGSTAEAQRDTAVEVAQQVLDVLQGRVPRYPVNAPALSADELEAVGPYLDLAQRLGRFYAQYKGDHLCALEVACSGDVVLQRMDLMVGAVLVGLLSGTSEEVVNWVNAPAVARERGIAFAARTDPVQSTAGWSNLVEVKFGTSTEQRIVAGAILRGEPHIVRVDGFWVDFPARGHLLVTEHVEQPGIIGRMGNILGSAAVNISFIQVGANQRGGPGVMVLGLDDVPAPAVMAQVLKLPSIRSAKMVKL